MAHDVKPEAPVRKENENASVNSAITQIQKAAR
jgi:hypothetical protein